MRFERMILVTGALGTVMAGAMIAAPASAAMGALDAISVCSRISKKDARLACYDQVARDAASGNMSANTPVPSPSSPDWAAPPPPMVNAPTTGAPQSFGSEQLRKPADDPSRGPDEVQSQVVSATDNGLGQWRITMADGAIWRMTESVPLFRPPAPQEAVRLRRGSLGSFFMDVGKQAGVRVARIR